MNPIHGGSVVTSFARSGNEVWVTIAGLGLGIFVVALISTGRRARASAARTAEVLQPESHRGGGRGMSDEATRAWRAMRKLVIKGKDGQREVCRALDLSYVKVRALEVLSERSISLGALAASLQIDAPYSIGDRRRSGTAGPGRAGPESGRRPVEGGQHHRDRTPGRARGRGGAGGAAGISCGR